MNKKSVYCTAPWNGLTVRENGQVKTCCIGLKLLGNLNTQSIQEIENSKILQQIKQDMLSGSPNLENCKCCVQLDQHTGYAPTREHYNKNYPTISDSLKLQSLDIRWNNVCNLGCLYCNPTFSNTWSDRLGIDITTPPVKPYQDDLLEWILERADHIKELMLVGGEPMLMKQNYELLKVLPLDCQISIITNLSYDLKNLPCLPDLLKRPADKILWNISGENTHQQFEYVRQGADWNQFEKNIKFLGQHWANSLTLGMVYSIFNAVDLLEIVKIFRSLGIQKFNLLPVNEHNPINVSFMPAPIRLLAKQVLDQVLEYHYDSLHPEDQDLYPIIGFDQVSKHLEHGGGHITGLADFQKQIKWYDQWSRIPFQDLWPNVVKLTNQHLI